MRNLKKILSLALALVMVMSLLTVASAKTFNDAADIEHTEAVEVMSALGVINGRNGNFDPKANVTRGEMAKMITYISLGNVEPTAFLGTTTNLTDIDGHWAEAYIKYCYSQGIISGRGNGTFDPNASVTATEAARMLLVAIGYNAAVQVYTGSQWAVNVVRDAQISHLYDDVSVLANETLSRDKAAQMMYNALTTKSVTKKASQSITTGEIIWEYSPNGEPLLEKSFDAKVFIGTLEGNTKSLGLPKDGYIRVNGKLETADPDVSASDANFPYDTDLTNIGEEVKVIFKDGTGGSNKKPDDKDTIYGVYVTGTTEVYNITKGDLQSCTKTNKIKFGGTEYEVADTTEANQTAIVINYGGVAPVKVPVSGTNMATVLDTNLRADSADTIKFVCNDDGKIVKAYVITKGFGVVSAVTAEKVGIPGVGTLTIADHVVYDGIAKDDVVMYTQLYDTNKNDAVFVVEPAEKVTGVLTYFYKGTKVAVDGTDTPVLAGTAPITNANGSAVYDKVSFTSSDLGDTYEFVKYGKYFVAAKLVSGDSNNYAIVITANNGDDIRGQDVKLLLADGTEQTFAIDPESQVGKTSLTTYYKNATVDLDDTSGTHGMLVSYTVQNNGKVKMTKLTSDVAAGEYDKTTKSFKSVTFADGTHQKITSVDAVAFVENGGKWKVYKAADLESINDATGTAQYKLSSDAREVLVFAIHSTAGASASNDNWQYAYLTADPRAYLEGNDTYTDAKGIDANGDEVTLKFENNEATNPDLKKGEYIRYKMGRNGLVAIGDVENMRTPGRVTLYDYDRRILELASGIYEVDKDVVIIHVNSDKKTAGTGVGVSVGDTVDTTKNNIVYCIGGGKIMAIFVDDNDDIVLVNGAEVPANASGGQINDALNSGDVTLPAGTTSVPAGVEVPAGKTLTVPQTINSVANDITVDGTIKFDKLTSAGAGEVELDGGKIVLGRDSTVVPTLAAGSTGTIELERNTSIPTGGGLVGMDTQLGGSNKTVAVGTPANEATVNNTVTRAPIALTGDGLLSSFSSSKPISYWATQSNNSETVSVYEIKLTGLNNDDKIQGYRSFDGGKTYTKMEGAYCAAPSENDVGSNDAETFVLLAGEKVTHFKFMVMLDGYDPDASNGDQLKYYNVVVAITAPAASAN